MHRVKLPWRLGVRLAAKGFVGVGAAPCTSRRWTDSGRSRASAARRGCDEAHPRVDLPDIVRINARTSGWTVGRPVRRRLFHVQNRRNPRRQCSRLATVSLARRATPQQTTLAHVTVVNVAEGLLLPDQNVVVSGNRIIQVSRASASACRGQVADATGKFLIPGLRDMHTQLFDVDTPGSTEVTFPLMIANGITGIRDTGAMLDLLMYWRTNRGPSGRWPAHCRHGCIAG